MPEYTLRNVPPELWSRFTERANREGWPIKALIISLLEAYTNGRVTPQTPAPKRLPQWAWLRQHYKTIAQAGDFAVLDANDQWLVLIDQVRNSPAAMSWRTLEDVPPEQRAEILRWLRETSNVESRHVFTLRAIASIGTGADLQTNRRVFRYRGAWPPEPSAGMDCRLRWRLAHLARRRRATGQLGRSPSFKGGRARHVGAATRPAGLHDQ